MFRNINKYGINIRAHEVRGKTYQGRLPNVLAVSPSCHMCSDWPLYLREGLPSRKKKKDTEAKKIKIYVKTKYKS